MKNWYNKNKSGYVALVTVLMLGAVGVAVAISLIFLGLGFSRTSASTQIALSAKALANTCMEEGLNQLQQNTSYEGTGNIAIAEGVCSYTVANTGGTSRSVSAQATIGTVTRRISTIVSDIAPRIIVSQWQEISN